MGLEIILYTIWDWKLSCTLYGTGNYPVHYMGLEIILAVLKNCMKSHFMQFFSQGGR
jgi:hypothetical protein